MTKRAGGINEELIRIQAEFCKGMAHPKRILILHLLKEGEKTVNQLEQETGIPQPNLSQHLSFMRHQGLVKTRREGNNTYYSLADKRIATACELIRESIKERLERMRQTIQEATL